MTDKRSMPTTGEVHVWYGDPDRLVSSCLTQAYRELVSEEERYRERRFQFDTDRRQYLFAHSLLRVVLSQYLDCAPTELEFQKNYYGKPALVYPESSGLEFNISHTSGLAVCAVARGGIVGVDVERSGRNVDELALAHRYFSPSEYDLLESAPTTYREQIFFRLWTLKEAYIKARGIGLSIPLDAFSFELSPNEPPVISFERAIDDSPDDWRFASAEISDRHHAAIAFQMPGGSWHGCQWREMIPLLESLPAPPRVAAR